MKIIRTYIYLNPRTIFPPLVMRSDGMKIFILNIKQVYYKYYTCCQILHKFKKEATNLLRESTIQK